MSKNKVALITGITGQDGAYLTKLLLDKGYKVFGTYRRSSTLNLWRLEELGMKDHPALSMVEYDLTDPSASIHLLSTTQPDEVYNLAAQSFVGTSFDQPSTTAQVNALGPVNLLEAIRVVNKEIRFYQASTSEMFGKVQTIPQTEKTPFYPRSPYGVAKLYGHWITINYRESYDIFACSGILFNHESPLRGLQFVTRKITKAVADIKIGKQEILELGNLDAKRDWGFAGDYVGGMHSMLQADFPDDYVLASGCTTSVEEFVGMAFAAADIPIRWEGENENKKAIRTETGKVVVQVNPKFYRPAEVDLLIGDSAKAANQLGWRPTVTLEKLCEMMVKADLERNSKGHFAF